MGLRTELGIRPPGRPAARQAIRRTAGTAPGAWVLARTLRHLDRAALAVIGSNFGHRSKHPGWVHDLAADPHCTPSYGRRPAEVAAGEGTGAGAEQVWANGREVYRGPATYPAMAGPRQIRVFVLEPAVR